MDNLRRLRALIHADLRERTRLARFWVILVVITGATWWLFPPIDASYSVMLIDEQRPIYSSAWIGLQIAWMSFLLTFFGFYVVRGSLTQDIETRVWQLLAASSLPRVAYLLAKWCANLLVLLLIMACCLGVGLMAQWLRAEDPAIDVWELVKPTVFLALPGLALTASFALWFDMLPWTRRSAGNILFFVVWIVVFVPPEKPDPKAWYRDPGAAFITRTATMAAVGERTPKSHCSGFCPVKTPPTTFAFTPWKVTPAQLAGRFYWLGLVLLSVAAATPFLNACASRVGTVGANATHSSGRQLRWLTRLLAPLQRSQGGAILAAELHLVLRQRKLWWWLLLLLMWGLQLFAPRDLMALAVVGGWVLSLDVFSRSALRDQETRTAAFVFSSVTAGQSVLRARALMLLLFAWASTGPAILRSLVSEPQSSLLIVLVGASVVAWGLALGMLTRGSRLFELLLCLTAYLAKDGLPVLNVLAAPQETLLWHAILLPVAVVAAWWLWPRMPRY